MCGRRVAAWYTRRRSSANALIERRGHHRPDNHQGFRDTLEIGRERKYELYDITSSKPRPLVPRHLRLGVPERHAADGSVHDAARRGSIAGAAGRLVDKGVTSLAIDVPALLRQPSARAARSGAPGSAGFRASRSAPRSTLRPKSASTSARRLRSSTPMSSPWLNAICPRWRANCCAGYRGAVAA